MDNKAPPAGLIGLMYSHFPTRRVVPPTRPPEAIASGQRTDSLRRCQGASMSKAYHRQEAKNRCMAPISKILLTTAENARHPAQVADLKGWISINLSQQRT